MAANKMAFGLTSFTPTRSTTLDPVASSTPAMSSANSSHVGMALRDTASEAPEPLRSMCRTRLIVPWLQKDALFQLKRRFFSTSPACGRLLFFDAARGTAGRKCGPVTAQTEWLRRLTPVHTSRRTSITTATPRTMSQGSSVLRPLAMAWLMIRLGSAVVGVVESTESG